MIRSPCGLTFPWRSSIRAPTCDGDGHRSGIIGPRCRTSIQETSEWLEAIRAGHFIALGALKASVEDGKTARQCVGEAIHCSGIDAEKLDPATACFGIP
jgi:hypothetical protein